MHNDRVKKDGKKQPLSNLKEAIPLFAFYSLVVCPVWFTTILPFSIVTFGLESLFKSLFNSKKVIKERSEEEITAESLALSKPTVARHYDLVLYGASGFTGIFSLNKLHKSYFNTSLNIFYE